jgi:hypothetical protein
MRNQELDHQLAEVNIPVKMADNPQNGFWADAKDIVSLLAPIVIIIALTIEQIEKLQSGPSRIDGQFNVALHTHPHNLCNYRSSQGIHVTRQIPTNLSSCFCRERRSFQEREHHHKC